jgi:glutathione S-transferase
MVIKLYGRSESLFTRLALIAFEETNTAYELHEVDYLAGDMDGEEYTEKQPFSQMPYMVCVDLSALRNGISNHHSRTTTA